MCCFHWKMSWRWKIVTQSIRNELKVFFRNSILKLNPVSHGSCGNKNVKFVYFKFYSTWYNRGNSPFSFFHAVENDVATLWRHFLVPVFSYAQILLTQAQNFLFFRGMMWSSTSWHSKLLELELHRTLFINIIQRYFYSFLENLMKNVFNF